MMRFQMLLAALAAMLTAAPLIAQDAGQSTTDAATRQKLMATQLDLELKGQSVHDACKLVAQAAGVAVVVDDSVTKTMTDAQMTLDVKASKIAAWQALELLCALKDLEFGVVGGVVRVQARVGKPVATTLRRFYVGDLCLALRDFPGATLGSGFYAHPPRYRLGLPLDRRLGRYGYRQGYGEDYYYGRDYDAVPLGVPYYESTPSFQRPIYHGRSRRAPFQQENLDEIAELVTRLKRATGGDANWERPGVGFRLARGSVLLVTHTPGTLDRIAAQINAERKKGYVRRDHTRPIR